MSGYKFHILVYLLAAFALTYALEEYKILALPPEYLALAIFIGAAYSILPDIDMPSSIIRRIVEKTSLAGILLLILAYLLFSVTLLIYAAIALAFFLLLLWYLKHRGFFHTMLAGIMLSAPLALIDPYLALYAFLGYSAHLFVDGKFFSLF